MAASTPAHSKSAKAPATKPVTTKSSTDWMAIGSGIFVIVMALLIVAAIMTKY